MTTATIAATVAADKTVRVSVTITGADPDELMSVYRVDGANRRGVLGGLGVPAASTVLVDAVVGLNRPIRWVVVLADASEVLSDPVTVTAARPILSDPWRGDACHVTVAEIDDELTMQARVEVLTIEGSTQPVAVVDVPTGWYGRLTLLTLTAEEADTVTGLAQTGTALLLRCSCGLHPDRWIQPTGDLTTSRLVARPALASRLHAWESCIYLPRAPWPDRPAAFDTLQDLADAVPGVLDDIAAAWATLGELAATDLSGGI